MEKKFIDVQGKKIAYLDNELDSNTILFIHGNSQASETFERQFKSKLNDHYRLIALDLHGQGDSENNDDYNLPIFAKQIVNFTNALKLKEVLFVGHSLGGHILLEALDRLPAVGAMIFGTPPLANPPAMDMAFLPAETMGLLFQESLNEKEIDTLVTDFTYNGEGNNLIKSCIKKSDGKVRSSIGASVGALNYKDEIEVIRTSEVPLAIIHGKEDEFINGDYIGALPYENLWQDTVFMLDGVGHFPQLENDTRFNELLQNFANEVIHTDKADLLVNKIKEVEKVVTE